MVLNTQNWTHHGSVYLKLKKAKQVIRSESKFGIPQLPLPLNASKGNAVELCCIENTIVGSVLLQIKSLLHSTLFILTRAA